MAEFDLIWRQGGILAGKVARILPGSLELSGEVLSKNNALLSSILRYDEKSRTFVAILYQSDGLLQKYLAFERNFG